MAGTRTEITIRPFPKPSCPYRRMISLTTPPSRETWRTIRCIAVMRRIGSIITRAISLRSASMGRCEHRKLSEEASVQRRSLGIVLGIFFAALIAMPVVIKHVSERHTSSGAAPDRDTVTARHGFCLQEVAKAAGLDFTHQVPSLDAKLAHIMPQVAA